MPTLKKLFVFAGTLLAVTAASVSNASAGTFTASATGELTGKARTTQVFSFGANVVKCTTAPTSGAITSTSSTAMHFTVKYSGCTGTILGFPASSVEVSAATWNITANGTAHLMNTITVKIPLLECHFTMKPQSVNLVNFTNNTGRLLLLFQLAQILYTSSGLCGESSSSNGTFYGELELERVGGGTISFD
jgi:hypothetical protein